jgi:inhibitor of KinA
MPHTVSPDLSPLGDRALLISLGAAIDSASHERVRAVCARLEARPVQGTIELVPAFTSVAVHYDPARVPEGPSTVGDTPYARFAASVASALVDLTAEKLAPPCTVDIPVCYGGVFGPDLEEVARRHGLTPDEVIRLHSDATYSVYMLGFAPGFAYLGGLAPEIATPRRDEPRTSVPAGSVGIGGSQTGVYPLATPGGWQLIGRTPLRLFDATRTPPTLLAVGDQVRFRVMSPEDFHDRAAFT